MNPRSNVLLLSRIAGGRGFREGTDSAAARIFYARRNGDTSHSVNIVADQNIPFAEEAYASLGNLRLVPASELAGALKNADVLIVRSVTRVNEALLAGTRVRFVGTATAGVDHVDTEYLAKRGITFASAAGCNATAVAQHVTAFLCALRTHWADRDRRTLGIVGVGHCGSRVEKGARALGFESVLCDPPLARETGSDRYRPLDELKGCDVLTLHTPLIRDGQDRTLGMIDEAYLRTMRPGAIVINTARGGLVDERALVTMLASGHLAAAATDAWEGEPQIDLEVLDAVTLATPHVAGYSLEGRGRGTEMIHEALCRHLGIAPHWTTVFLSKPESTIRITPDDEAPGATIATVVLTAHPIGRLDAELRSLHTHPNDQRAAYFENLRKTNVRHEFSAFSIEASCFDPDLKHRLEALGFSIETGAEIA